MPDLLIIAGVNGAGKSTIFPSIQRTERIEGSFQPGPIEDENFINADDIERITGGSQISAARQAIANINEKIDQGINIGLESTISGMGFVMNAIRKAKSKGYRIYIVYIFLYSPELSMARVVQRALLGKHYIPMEKVIDRFPKSINNFFNSYKDQADYWVVLDNSNLIPSVLCWGGLVYNDNVILRESEESMQPLINILAFNKIDISFNYFGTEMFSPFVFKKITEQVEKELKRRPAGTTLVSQESEKLVFKKV
jgi:predicted ABC-type ATPase